MTDSPSLFSVLSAPADAAELPEPTNGPYFVLSQDAVMVHRNFHFGRVIVPIHQLEMLPKLDSKLWYDINLPREIIEQAWSFFRAILKSKNSEAMVDIVYDDDQARRAARTEKQGWDDLGYRLFVPPQRASHGGVEAKRNGEHYRGQIVGTIHSHCDFNAFHSGTDTHDSDGHDGLHITIGQNAHPQPQIATMMAVGDQRWHFQAADIWGDAPYVPLEHPTWWERYVSPPLPANTGHISTWKGVTPAPHNPQFPIINRGPAPTTPTVISGSKNKDPNAYDDINEVLAYYSTVLDDDQVRGLEDARDDIDAIENVLYTLGFDFNYTIGWDKLPARNLTSDENEDQDPTVARYVRSLFGYDDDERIMQYD